MTSDGTRAFDDWFGANRLDENLFVQNYELGGNDVPGWRLERSRTVHKPDGPPIRRSFWRVGDKVGDKEDTVLAVELIECPSRGEAHRTLAALVGDYESPEVARDEGAPVGDVSFAVPSGTAVVFARANVVVQVRNAGRDVVPVGEVAGAVDVQLYRRPETGGIAVPSVEGSARTITLPAGGAAEVTMKSTDPLGGPVTLRYYSRLGEVAVVDGVTVYQAERPGEDLLVVVATSPTGGSTEASVDVVVS